jgi:hypothetical protein
MIAKLPKLFLNDFMIPFLDKIPIPNPGQITAYPPYPSTKIFQTSYACQNQS